jgi:hypothetical protein
VAIVAIFREPVPQAFHLLAQTAHLLTVLLDQGLLLPEHLLLLLDDCISLRQLFPQNFILFSQIDKFFFNRHAFTLLGLTLFGKSPADLGSYEYNKYGDVILWFQMLDFAKSIRKPILFVTDDGKSDWYLSKEESKGIMKPRPELVQEMLVEANVIVQLYQGYEFLDKATTYLDLQQKPEVIEEAKEISEQNTLEIERPKYDAQAFARLAFQAEEAVYNWLKERYPGKFIKRFPDFGIDYILETESGERIGVIIKYSNQNFTGKDIMQINTDIERQMNRYERNMFFLVCGNKKEADDGFANFKQINFEAMKVELRVGYITSFGYYVTVDDREE